MKYEKNEFTLANHILPTSSNLLGICFVLLSFIKLIKIATSTYLDEALLIPILLLFAASFFYYLSLRNNRTNFPHEKLADLMFMAALLVLTVISVVIVFQII